MQVDICCWHLLATVWRYVFYRLNPSTLGIADCQVWGRALGNSQKGNLRTQQQATEIFDAGQTILQSHLFLTTIHMRPGLENCLKCLFFSKHGLIFLGLIFWYIKLEPEMRRTRQQREVNLRGDSTPIQWIVTPKLHSFDHQLQTLLRTRMNSRHSHCFVDEDSMKKLKSLAIRHPSVNLESFLLRASRLQLKLSAKKMASLRRSSAKRSGR